MYVPPLSKALKNAISKQTQGPIIIQKLVNT